MKKKRKRGNKKGIEILLVAILVISVFTAIEATGDELQAITSVSTTGLTSSGEAVPGQVIVGFKDVMTAEQNALVDKYGGAILDRNSALNCVLVEVDETQKFITAISKEESLEYAEPNYLVKALHTPNDLHYPQQWGPPVIKADLAWDTEKGDYNNVKIAIVDTGIDYNHEDLGNYVAGGYDWVNSDSDPLDDNGHGTHCAGIAAAVMDNSIGVAGIAQVQVMAEKVLNETGYGSYWVVSQGLTHAADQNADVISMSLGGDSYSSTLENACQYAWDAGCILTGAAGNDYQYGIAYPAKFETVICVGAIDQSNNRASFSNWGLEMELIAPGVSIKSSYLSDTYVYKSGTSMSTPHVAGVAALVWSNCPGLTNQEVRDLMDDTADDLGPPDWDEEYGYGRVDAEEAIECGVPQEEPDIWVDPTSFDVTLPPDTTWSDILEIGNNGGATLTYFISDEETTTALGASEGKLEFIYQEEVDVSADEVNVPEMTNGLKAAYTWGSTRRSPNILVYTDDSIMSPGTTYVEQALQDELLGYTAYYSDPDGFGNALTTGGPWDMVLVSHNTYYGLGNWWTEIEDYVDGGGTVVIETFDIDGSHSESTTLWTTLGVSYVSDLGTPEPVYRWQPSHPIFTQVENVPNLSTWSTDYYDDGDKCDPLSPTIAVAGFTCSETTGEGALFTGSIVNSFVISNFRGDDDSDGKLDAVELWQNEIAYSLAGLDCSWLDENPKVGSVPPGNYDEITVSIDTTGLAPGDYNAEIIIDNNDPDSYENPTIVPVNLTVITLEPPDLVIVDKWEEMDWDGNYYVGYEIQNIGEGTAYGAGVTCLYIDGVHVAEDDLSYLTLEPGESYWEMFWEYALPCNCSLNNTVCADNYDEVEETDEENNCLTKTWSCPWKFKPAFPNYAPSGMPDFDQKQDNWFNFTTWQWSFCGPVSVANCFWWFDSMYADPSGTPGDGNDIFPLVENYGVADDHLAANVPPLVEQLAMCMNTDGSGTNVHDMEDCIDEWLNQTGLDGVLYEHTEKNPDFYWIAEELERCQNIILLLGFWEEQEVEPGVWEWRRIGGHYVTVAGVNTEAECYYDGKKGERGLQVKHPEGFDTETGYRTGMYIPTMIALSDPFLDNAEVWEPGRVLPPWHPPAPHPPTVHNDALFVSHDYYWVEPWSESPGGEWWIPDYPSWDCVENFSGMNVPPEFEYLQGDWQWGWPHTEIEYAVVVSPYIYIASVDDAGDKVDVFAPGADVLVKGCGFAPNLEYTIYIQPDRVLEGQELNVRIDPSGVQETITTDARGCFGPTVIWEIPPEEPTCSHWDIVVDKTGEEGEGTYNAIEDGLDNVCCYGFHVGCEPSIEVNKTVWDPETEQWVDEINATLNETLRFRCVIHNSGTCSNLNLTEIWVWDNLSDSLNYSNNATVQYPDGTTIPQEPDWIYYDPNTGWTYLDWDFWDVVLEPCQNITIEFDARAVKCGIDENIQFAEAWCEETGDWVFDADSVTVIIEEAPLTIVKVEPESQTVFPGQSFSVNITVENVTFMGADQGTLNFNSSAMQATGVVEGDFLKSAGATIPYTNIDNTAGTVEFSYALMTGGAGADGSGTLATIHFDTDPAAEGTFPLGLTGVVLADGNGGPITVDEEFNGTVTIRRPPALVNVTPKVQTVSAGSGFQVNITVENVTFMGADQVTLNFNSSAMQAAGVKEGDFLKSAGPTIGAGMETIDNANGFVTFYYSLMTHGVGVSGDGTLATIYFDTDATAEGVFNLNLTDVLLADGTGTGIPVETYNGTANLISFSINITSPENSTYASACVRLNYTVEPAGTVLDWTGYSLDGGANETVTGNTTVGSLGACGHNIVVYANDTNGNMAASNTVFFTTHPGDISGDGVVNIFDLQRLAWAFNTKPGDPDWNEEADLNCDNKVNVFDLQILGWNFGNDYTVIC